MNAYTIRHKVTKEVIQLPSKKTVWTSKASAKNAWAQLRVWNTKEVESNCEKYGVPTQFNRHGRIEFPRFDDQTVWEIVELTSNAITVEDRKPTTTISGLFNKLTPKRHELLIKLMEECGETVQACGKIQIHGFESGYNGKTNREMLTEEMGDLLAFIILSCNEGMTNRVAVCLRAMEKINKIHEYTHHLPKYKGSDIVLGYKIEEE